MKKINKTRKITENDLRNLHYIHENEGLIPDGVTKLEDEDITSAEVITENKKSKVNESVDGEYTVEEYLDDFEQGYVSISYKKVLAYKKMHDEMSDDEFQKLNKQYEKLEATDLQEKVDNGELTEEEAMKQNDKLITKSLKIFRKMSGGTNPEWYEEDMAELDPDLTAKEKEEGVDIEKIQKEAEKEGERKSPKEYTEKEYEKFCKNNRISLPYEKVKFYMEQWRSFTKKQKEDEEEKRLNVWREKSALDDKLEKGEITQEEYDEKNPDILRRWLKGYRVTNGGADPKWYDPDTMQDIDPDLSGGVNESDTTYNIDFWVDKKDPSDTKEEANNILRMLGYPPDPSQSDLEEIIRHFDVDYNGDSDYEEYIVTLLGYYYLMFGRTEFYKNYVSKYGVAVNESSVETNNQYWEFVQKFKESVGEDSEIYRELMTQLQAIKDYDVHTAYNLTKEFLENKGLWDEYSSDFEAIPVNEDDMDEFRKLIDSDVWKKFKEDWKGTDVYDAAMDAISYVDTLPQMIKGLKRVFDVYDMLVDYEAELDKLLSSSVNEDNPSALSQLTDSDVWKKFKQDQGENSEVYRAAMGAMHNVMSSSYDYHDLSELIAAVKKVLAVCDVLSAYEEDLDKLLSTSINEYKTVGVYKPNDGEVEDLYYIQAGDIILIHHKDYGELQCKVKKVDADKNKVYFVTIERGIMGVCGFDKIHGIQLVEECQKQPMFVQTKHIKFPEGGMCYMCYAKVGNRFIDVYCTFGMSLDNCECIKLLNMTADEFGIIDNIMSESDTFEDAKNRVYNSGLVSL